MKLFTDPPGVSVDELPAECQLQLAELQESDELRHLQGKQLVCLTSTKLCPTHLSIGKTMHFFTPACLVSPTAVNRLSRS